MSYLFIVITIALTVYGQVAIKWRVSGAVLPEAGAERFIGMLQLVMDPWVISAYVAALLASLSWMAAVSKLPLSHAYPFMSSAFVIVMLLSAVFFAEPITVRKVVGLCLIVAGLVVASQG